MSEIKTYKKGEFSQINLDDDTKALISLGFSDVKVFKLGFMGFPKETIWSYERKAGELTYRGDVFDILVKNIQKFSSLQEVKDFFNTIKEKGFEERLVDYGLLDIK